MSEFPKTSLRDKIFIKHGFAFKGEHFKDSGDLIVLTPGNFYEEGGFKRQFGKEKFYSEDFPSEYLLKKDDLLVAMTEQAEGLLGSMAFVPESNLYLHNQRLGLITTDPETVNRRFLYHLSKTKYFRQQLRLSSSGTKVKHTSPDRIYDVEVFLPTIEIQIKIASFLDSFDKKIELNNKINVELEAMAKTLYDYWFVQFDFPDENGKPYKSSGGKMVWNENLQANIPKNWIDSTFGEYAEVKKGDLITARDSANGEVKVVAAGIDFSYMHSVANRPKNTITISGSGANAGYVNFWREPIFASDCITVRGKSDSETILLFQNLKMLQNHILKQATGSAQPHVYPNDIKKLFIAIPSKNETTKFEKFIIPLNDQIANNLKENQALTSLRDWLLPMLMNGQIKVE
jgi:type I restriction enzyme S subunit